MGTRLRRGAAAVELLILALGGLLGVAGLAASRSPAVRKALLERVARVVESRYGVAIAATDFRWEADRKRLVFDGLRVGASGEDPLLTAERATIGVRLAALMASPATIESIELERPTVDLGAPVPQLGGGEKDDGGPGIEIGRIGVRDGRLLGLPAPERAAGWLDSWSAEGIELVATVRDGRLEARLVGSTLRLAGRELGERTARLVGRGSGPLSGPWRFEPVRLSSEGLDARVAGTVGVDDDGPLEVTFRIEGEPALWLPGRGLAGAVEAEGRMDLRGGSGELRLGVDDLAIAAALGVFSSEGEPLAPLAATALDLSADLRLGPGSLERLDGEIRLQLRRGDRRLASVSVAPASGPEGELRLPVEVRLLPDAPGRRQTSATLVADGLSELTAGRWREGRLEMRLTRAADLVAQVNELWPGLVDPAAGGEAVRRNLEGPLRLEARFEGPLADPEATATLSLGTGGGSLEMRASGRPAQLEGTATVTTSGFELAGLGIEGISGRVEARAEMRRRAAAPLRGGLELEASELTVPGQAPLDRLALAARLEGADVAVERLTAERAGLRLTGGGAVTLSAPLALPVRQGEAALRLRHPELGAAELPLRLRLRQGVLTVDTGAAEDGSPLELEAEVPLALLGPRTEGIVAVAAEGEATARWRLPERDWSGLLAALGQPALELLRAGSRGSLRVDPARPADAGAWIALEGVAARWSGLDLRAAGELLLRLEDGRLRLDPAEITIGESGSLRLRGDARLRPEWTFAQPALDPEVGLVTSFDLSVEGAVPASLLPGVAEASGEVAIDAELAGSLDSFRARGVADATGAVWSIGTDPARRIEQVRLVAAVEEDRVELQEVRARIEGVPVSLAGSVRRHGGAVRARFEPVVLAQCGGWLEAEVPWPLALSPASSPPALEPEPAEATPVSAAWEFAACDWDPLLRLATGPDGETNLRASLAGSASFDPGAPAAGTAMVEIGLPEARVEGRRITSRRPVVARLEGGVLRLEATELVADGQLFAVEAALVLDPAWTPNRGAEALVRRLRLDAEGSLVASLLNPMLAGGTASGVLELTAHLEGPPRALSGEVRASGPQVSILYPTPYLTKIEDLQLVAAVESGAVSLDGSELLLNEGRVQLLGGLGLDGEIDLRAVFAEVRYRLDYGLLATLGGAIDWTGRLDGDSKLSGRVRLTRGVLTRPIELDRDFLADLLVPVDLTGTEGGPLERIALDLEVSTREGVRIRNNLADLLVLWDPLKVGGTVQMPLVEGTLEVQAGGVLFAPGQTVVLERASITYPGRPGAAPELEFATMTTSDEPAFSRERVLSAPGGRTEEEAPDPAAGLAGFSEGVAIFYGEQVAARVGEALGGTEISLRPIPVFGETDPATRLNVSRDFSPRVAVVASIDLRNAEGQTYLLDVHDLPYFTRVRGQLFTLDDGSEGATLQQELELGGSRPSRESGPRIQRITVEGRPAGASGRGLRRAVRLEKGDRMGEGDRFAAEVEVAEYLRRRGYPAARVEVTATPAARGGDGVDLRVTIEAGVRVAYRFAGDKPPDRLRGSIVSLYRADFWEEASLTEMREQAIRVWRSRGYLEPRVTVEVVPPDAEGIDRVVVVHSEAGPRIEPEVPVFEGLPEDEASFVAGRFWSPVQRTELALGLPDAERRVIQALSDLGYPEATVVDRAVSDEGRRLMVTVEPGPRRRVGAVAVTGFDGELPDPALEAGDPARADRIAAAAGKLRRELEGRGYPDAKVWARLEPLAGDPLAVRVEYEVVAGERYRFGSTSFDGLKATREKWARSIARLPAQEAFVDQEVRDARRRLYRTGLFSTVSSRIERSADGGPADVVFELDERPRYRLSYGLRWDNERGGSVVVDGRDTNFFGRGIELGVRALYSTDERSFRVALDFPRVLGGKGDLKWFNLVDREIQRAVPSDLQIDSFESTVQYSHPLGQNLRGRVYASWLDSRLREVDPDPFFPIDTRTQRPVLGLQVFFDSRGGALLPERGLFASVDLSGSSKRLASDFSYIRAFAQTSYFRPLASLGGRRLIWAQSARVGAAEAFGQRLVLDRFFAGGAFSVRGYPTESLGPQEVLGRIRGPIGGAALLVVNQELRYPVIDRLTLLLFFDAGNVWEELTGVDSELFKSLGLGFRAITPLGLLRLDAAYTLDRRETDPEYKLHFGFGSTF